MALGAENRLFKAIRFGSPLLTDFPLEYYTGEPHLEITGNFECVVDGLKAIEEYSSEKIRLNTGKRSVTFHGEDLHINSLSPQGAVVQGFIMSMEFSDAD